MRLIQLLDEASPYLSVVKDRKNYTRNKELRLSLSCKEKEAWAKNKKKSKEKEAPLSLSRTGFNDILCCVEEETPLSKGLYGRKWISALANDESTTQIPFSYNSKSLHSLTPHRSFRHSSILSSSSSSSSSVSWSRFHLLGIASFNLCSILACVISISGKKPCV